MHEGKYIRFDSTQERRTRATCAEYGHYRIIARTQASDRSLTRVLVQHAWPRHNASIWSATLARCAALMCVRIPALLIFSTCLQGSTRRKFARLLICANQSQASQTLREAKRSPAASVSNRNGAHAGRNRIFLHRRYHIFVVGPLQTRAPAHESHCESSDSARLIRLEVRRLASSSALRSPLADWLCRRSTSSPDRRTSPTSRAWSSPVPPYRDSQRRQRRQRSQSPQRR
jgi:hypothetical protein